MSLIKTTTNHVFSAALSGFGLSLGRDIYRKAGKNKGVIIGIIIVVLCMFMVYSIGVWIARNQKNLFFSLIAKIFSISLLPIFGAISSVCFVLILGTPDAIFKEIGQGDPFFLGISNSLREYHDLVFGYFIQLIFEVLINFSPEFDEIGKEIQNSKSSYMYLSNFLVLCIFLLGLYRGSSQRRERKNAWESEKHNHKFLDANGISEIGDKYRDSDYQEYRFESIGQDVIELFPEGTRGKRAYIKFDKNGFFTDWSGLITQAEKKDFMSGSISKTVTVDEN